MGSAADNPGLEVYSSSSVRVSAEEQSVFYETGSGIRLPTAPPSQGLSEHTKRPLLQALLFLKVANARVA